ncbi:SOCS box [Paragonimus heterotremus]|uniref:SOCS box n=1 Tax=Paragonimus heterotremus TaxID=100268 RepID=A0A8J4X038_9TREM|nr:SOCS box [Paragonimus heterotremus]
MSNKRNRRSLLWITCFCAESRAAIREEADEKLVRLIQKGNLTTIERALRRIGRPLNEVTLIVKRRHLSTAYPCLVDHRAAGTDPFINFYQECSPVIWAVDCLQWQVLPLLARYGCDINRPQTCRRWTYICAPSSRPNTAPYRRFWTRGRYTYQSALDYFFASVYEFVGEQPSSYNGLCGPSPLTFYFSHLPALLSKGVDVHRIDSVIVFNSLATSYDQYLCRYTNEHATVPDIPENDDAFVEMTAMKRLIENGFSQFECMDYLYPCCNWFGILLCLLCHPKIDTYGNNLLPSIIRQAALLLINLLALKCTVPTVDEFGESLENLHLRKVYSKRYVERRDVFNCRLASLHRICQEMLSQPLCLKILTRNAVRKQIGGIDFCRKLSFVGLPPQLNSFVQFIGQEHLKASHMPKQLIRLAQGEWVDVTLDRKSSQRYELDDANWTRPAIDAHQVSLTTTTLAELAFESFRQRAQLEILDYTNFVDASCPIWSRELRRGRASERQRLTTVGRIGPGHDRHECNGSERIHPVRPRSAPLPVLQTL